MSRAIDRAVAHFKSIVPRVIEVPEWGDENGPFKVYVSPLTIQDRDKLASSGDKSAREMLIDAIIMKAKDEAGEPLFTLEDKPQLRRNVESSIIDRIGVFIIATPNAEDAEKN